MKMKRLTALCLCACLWLPAGVLRGFAEAPVDETDDDPAALAAAISLLPEGEAKLELSAPSVILVEKSTGAVICQKDPDTVRPIASITKVMTLLLVLEAVERGDIAFTDTVTASAHACSMGGSQIYLEEGEQMTVEELVKAVVVGSANDAAVALAEFVCGSETAFAARMNERAAELGMTNTHFTNACGLDVEGHCSTARDVALMSRALLGHDVIRQYTTLWMDSVRNGEFGLTNTNKLIKSYAGITGLKTGYTSTALHCITATAEREGMELIAVVLGAPSSKERFVDAAALLDYGFAQVKLVKAVADPPDTVPVEGGTVSAVGVVPLENEVRLVVPKTGGASVQWEAELAENLRAPVEKGQTAGTLRFTMDGITVAETPLVTTEAVPRLNFWQTLLRLLEQLCFTGGGVGEDGLPSPTPAATVTPIP